MISLSEIEEIMEHDGITWLNLTGSIIDGRERVQAIVADERGAIGHLDAQVVDGRTIVNVNWIGCET